MAKHRAQGMAESMNVAAKRQEVCKRKGVKEQWLAWADFKRKQERMAQNASRACCRFPWGQSVSENSGSSQAPIRITMLITTRRGRVLRSVWGLGESEKLKKKGGGSLIAQSFCLFCRNGKSALSKYFN